MKKKKQTNIKKTLTLLVVLGLLSWIPLKAEKDNDSEILALKQGSVFTFTTSQLLTPLEKPSFDTSAVFELSKNNRTYDFSLKPIQLKIRETKYPETYKTIQNYKKTHVFEKSLFEATLIANVALNAADYFTTREALKYDGLQEGNPFMKPFMKNDMTFAAVKIGLTVSNYFIMKKLYKRNKTLGWIVGVISNLALSYVVSSNMAHIHEARNR
ncbi:MAG: DUF5658 family protein [Candidatus Aminicenantes bacterium]